jgi:hypothetical protein
MIGTLKDGAVDAVVAALNASQVLQGVADAVAVQRGGNRPSRGAPPNSFNPAGHLNSNRSGARRLDYGRLSMCFQRLPVLDRQRRVHEMLGDKPDLQFISPEHTANQ